MGNRYMIRNFIQINKHVACSYPSVNILFLHWSNRWASTITTHTTNMLTTREACLTTTERCAGYSCAFLEEWSQHWPWSHRVLSFTTTLTIASWKAYALRCLETPVDVGAHLIKTVSIKSQIFCLPRGYTQILSFILWASLVTSQKTGQTPRP